MDTRLGDTGGPDKLLFLEQNNGVLSLYLTGPHASSPDNGKVNAAANFLRERGFCFTKLPSVCMPYGEREVTLAQIEFYKDEDPSLTEGGWVMQAELFRELQEKLKVICTARGSATITALYLDDRHINTEVTITVQEGEVTTSPEHAGYIVWHQDSQYSFFLVNPHWATGRFAPPAKATIRVAEAYGIFVPQRIGSDAAERVNLVRTTTNPGFPSTLEFM